MKRISGIKTLAFFVSMLLLQFNLNIATECLADEPVAEPAKTADESVVEPAKTADEPATEPAKTADESSPEAKSATDENPTEANKAEGQALLADKHKKAGIECAICHKETPPAVEAPKAICLTCHANYADQAASYIDPHNAHVEFSNCSDCHHVHKKSENQCLQCHTFNLDAP